MDRRIWLSLTDVGELGVLQLFNVQSILTYENDVEFSSAEVASWMILQGNMDANMPWSCVLVNWYCICKRNGKDADHLLLHCELMAGLLSLVYSLFNVT